MSCSCRYGSCWCVTPWDKMMRSRVLTSFCQLHKSDHKNTCLHKKVFTSRHDLFVQISLSVMKTIETFQAPKRDSWCLPQIYQQLHILNDLQNVALAIIIERQNKRNFSDQCQTKFLLPKSKWILRSSQDSFVQFCDRSSSTKTTQSIWKMVWFSMSLYKFKSSRCSPCNQSSQRRRKVYRCWVSSSPIKRAKHETCKYAVNHHGWSDHQGEKQIHFFQCIKDQWIHLTTDVTQFHN